MIVKIFYNTGTGLIESVEESQSSTPLSSAELTALEDNSNYGVIQVCTSDPDVADILPSVWSETWKVDTTEKKLIEV